MVYRQLYHACVPPPDPCPGQAAANAKLLCGPCVQYGQEYEQCLARLLDTTEEARGVSLGFGVGSPTPLACVLPPAVKSCLQTLLPL